LKALTRCIEVMIGLEFLIADPTPFKLTVNADDVIASFEFVNNSTTTRARFSRFKFATFGFDFTFRFLLVFGVLKTGFLRMPEIRAVETEVSIASRASQER